MIQLLIIARIILMKKQQVYDVYGFKTSAISLAVQSYLIDPEKQQERIQTWQKILKTQMKGEEQQRIIRQEVRKGIPDKLRPAVWMRLITPPLKQYQTIQVKEELKEIDRDIGRTIPTNKRQAELKEKLKHVLNVLAVAFPEMGYCQGLNFIVANLLLLLNEKQTYNVMFHILYWQGHERLMSNLDMIHIKLYTLTKLMKKHFPQLSQCLESKEVQPLLFASSWFITLFNNTLPCQYVFRILQIYFLEGQKILYRVALQILKEKKKVLKKLNTTQDVIAELKSSQEFSKALIDKFFKDMFEINLSRKQIQDLQKKYENKNQNNK